MGGGMSDIKRLRRLGAGWPLHALHWVVVVVLGNRLGDGQVLLEAVAALPLPQRCGGVAWSLLLLNFLPLPPVRRPRRGPTP